MIVLPFSEITSVTKKSSSIMFGDSILIGSRSKQPFLFSSLRNRQVFPPSIFSPLLNHSQYYYSQALYDLIMERMRTVDFPSSRKQSGGVTLGETRRRQIVDLGSRDQSVTSLPSSPVTATRPSLEDQQLPQRDRYMKMGLNFVIGKNQLM